MAVNAVEGVGQVATVGLEHIGQAEAELELGAELEIGQVDVASEAKLDPVVYTPQQHRVATLAAHVELCEDARQHVGAVVVEAHGGVFEVDGDGQIVGAEGGDELLLGLRVDEGEAFVTKVDGRREAYAEDGVEEEVADNADAESGRVGRYLSEPRLAVGASHAGVGQDQILRVQPDVKPEVVTLIVDIRLILWASTLRLEARDGHQPQAG